MTQVGIDIFYVIIRVQYMCICWDTSATVKNIFTLIILSTIKLK